MHEAEHVVLRGPSITGNRECRVARGEPGGLGHAQRGIEEDHLGARHHQLAHVPVAGGEHVVDELALLRSSTVLWATSSRSSASER